MPILLHTGYYDNFSPDMNNIKYSKQYVSNIMKSNSKLANDNQYLNALRSNVYNQPIDAKSLEGLVSNVKNIYKNNIDLMIKLKNSFSMTPVVRPIAPPVGVVSPPPPPVAPAPVAPVAPLTTPSASPYLPFSSYFGFGKGKKRGGAVGIVEQYGIGTRILTLIDSIQNNNDNLKTDLMKLVAYRQYLSPTNINDIFKLHSQFFNYFNENVVPFRMTHIIPPFSSSLIGVDYTEIIDKLNELYVNYSNEFNRLIIPKLTNSQ
jgi:hypothetical protein